MNRVLCLLFLLLAGCASNVISYVPPSHQAIPRELYSVELPLSQRDTSNIIREVMSSFSYLTQQGNQLVYKGNSRNPIEYVDCGHISANYVGSATKNIPYATPESQFMGFENESLDKLSTNLDFVVSFALKEIKTGTLVTVDVQYTFNRQHTEGRTIFRTAKVSDYKSSPINFNTIHYGSAPDGITCKSKLFLEYEIISKLEEAL